VFDRLAARTDGVKHTFALGSWGVIRLYSALCVLGAALPLAFLVAFLADEGVDPRAFYGQATGSNIALFAWADVVAAGLTVLLLAIRDRLWTAVVATVLVGPSLGLPLLLLMRERRATEGPVS
jgi:hypothetical protein